MPGDVNRLFAVAALRHHTQQGGKRMYVHLDYTWDLCPIEATLTVEDVGDLALPLTDEQAERVRAAFRRVLPFEPDDSLWFSQIEIWNSPTWDPTPAEQEVYRDAVKKAKKAGANKASAETDGHWAVGEWLHHVVAAAALDAKTVWSDVMDGARIGPFTVRPQEETLHDFFSCQWLRVSFETE